MTHVPRCTMRRRAGAHLSDVQGGGIFMQAHLMRNAEAYLNGTEVVGAHPYNMQGRGACKLHTGKVVAARPVTGLSIRSQVSVDRPVDLSLNSDEEGWHCHILPKCDFLTVNLVAAHVI
ncbi:hypothetical protein B0H17DRAFT_1141711 [Mycena rosella]|uniref:Uncharacterized protein n=1 Tax=Mycena rosella TaxID=1033263 RepID=A0AAD7CYY8_MYCRO|nr:hypothetical protein B0H17DRAFT_1141711 [Mycena rosella]